MKKGICPKCQSKEVYSGTRLSKKSGFYNSNTIPLSGLRSAVLDNFVCGNCGYLESYIAKERDLLAIKKKWPLVY